MDRRFPAAGADTLVMAALGHHQAGQLAEAQALYARALDLEPDHPDGLHLAGMLAFQLGRAELAAALIGRAVAVSAATAPFHHSLGTVLEALGRPVEAEASYRQALALDPAHGEALNALGNTLGRRGRHDEAAEAYRRALLVTPGLAGIHSNLGNALAALGRFDEAVACYRRALELDPGSADAESNLGMALGALGRADEALACYRRALELRPGHGEAHNNLGSLLLDLGQAREALACFERAAALAPTRPEVQRNLGAALRTLGRLDEAAAGYRQALALKPESLEAHAGLSAVLAELGRAGEAAVHLRRCLELDPTDRLGVRMRLAALGLEPVPEQVPAARLDALYQRRAHFWDQRARAGRPYNGAMLVARAVETLMPGTGTLDILDAGCGTGLVGELVAPRARRLDGVDLSSAMLEKARQKGIYRELHLGDLVPFLAGHAQAYDVVTCAATLIHLRDLRPAFEAAAIALRDGGLFVFTLFPHDGERDGDEVTVGSIRGLAQGGCYVHGRRHVARLAEAAGFTVEILADEVHEHHRGQPVTGLLVALRRRCRHPRRAD